MNRFCPPPGFREIPHSEHEYRPTANLNLTHTQSSGSWIGAAGERRAAPAAARAAQQGRPGEADRSKSVADTVSNAH
eukprot:2664733-Prymnesium_polylepis.1